jgi:hypothetical protein
MTPKEKEYEEIIKSLKLYFDYATIDEIKLYRQLGKQKYKRYHEAVTKMFDTFKDE